MGLDCLLVTCDPALLAQMGSAFRNRPAGLEVRQDSASATELANRRHLDGLIIDCDDVAGGTGALSSARESRSNKDTLIVAIVNGLTNTEAALDLGANFVLCKPIPETRLRNVLDIAFTKMECEHRRYFRYNTNLPVHLRNHLEQTFPARMKNISEGGMAIRLIDPVHLTGVVPVEFDIPSIETQFFQAKADVVWSDSFEMGLRFLHINKESGVALKSWLNLLEAQLQLRAPGGFSS